MRLKMLTAVMCTMLASSAAEACDFWRDQAGMLRGNCKLEQATDGRFLLDLDLELTEVRPSRYQLKVPNLQIRRFRYSTVGGNNFELFADVRNVDAGSAPTSPLVVLVNILVAGSTSMQSTFPYRTVNVPPLAPNSETRVSLGTYTLPNRIQDWDVAVTGVIDPPTPAQRVSGAVFESNETDNATGDLCRIYGTNPNQVGPRACL